MAELLNPKTNQESLNKKWDNTDKIINQLTETLNAYTTNNNNNTSETSQSTIQEIQQHSSDYSNKVK